MNGRRLALLGQWPITCDQSLAATCILIAHNIPRGSVAYTNIAKTRVR